MELISTNRVTNELYFTTKNFAICVEQHDAAGDVFAVSIEDAARSFEVYYNRYDSLMDAISYARSKALELEAAKA